MLTFSEVSLHLGNLSNGQPMIFTATLGNSSDKTINITNIRPGCGSCTTARVDNIQIQPNGNSTLTATFTPNGLGAIHKSIFIDYQIDGLPYNTTFQFTANVI